MVVEASAIRRTQVLNALNRLSAANLHIVGAVLNKFNRNRSGYGYGYDYADRTEVAGDDDRKIVLTERD
jgi:Mrp family chromosome partitioning ATPase